jgi:hypothetical protein
MRGTPSPSTSGMDEWFWNNGHEAFFPPEVDQ